MHGEERLLYQIFDFAGGSADAAREISPQKPAEEAEELTMRVRISLQAADHERPEALFGLVLLQH
jgi:hypothetical protein